MREGILKGKGLNLGSTVKKLLSTAVLLVAFSYLGGSAYATLEIWPPYEGAIISQPMEITLYITNFSVEPFNFNLGDNNRLEFDIQNAANGTVLWGTFTESIYIAPGETTIKTVNFDPSEYEDGNYTLRFDHWVCTGTEPIGCSIGVLGSDSINIIIKNYKSTKIKIGQEKIEYTDADGVTRKISLTIQLTTAPGTTATEQTFTVDNQTFYARCQARDGAADFNISDGNYLNGFPIDITAMAGDFNLSADGSALGKRWVDLNGPNFTAGTSTVDINGVQYAIVSAWADNSNKGGFVRLRADGNCEFSTQSFSATPDYLNLGGAQNYNKFDGVNTFKTVFYDDDNTARLPLKIPLGVKNSSMKDTYNYRLVVGKTSGKVWLLLDSNTDFSNEISNAGVRFEGTDRGERGFLHPSVPFYLPDTTDIADGDSGDYAYYTAQFSIDANGGTPDVKIAIDTATGNLVQYPNNNLSNYNSDANCITCVPVWNLNTRTDVESALKGVYMDDGTKFEITDGKKALTATIPKEPLQLQFLISGAVEEDFGGIVTSAWLDYELTAPLKSASGTKPEVVAALGKTELPLLHDETLTYRFNGSTYEIVVKETIGIESDAKFDSTNSTVKDLVAYMSGGDLNYVLSLGTGIPAWDSTTATTTAFNDGDNDNIVIPLLGSDYTVQRIDNISSTKTVMLVRETAKTAYNEGQVITGLSGKGNYAGQLMSVKFVAVTQSGAASMAYNARFELYDARDRLVDVQVVGEGTYLNEGFVDIFGQYALGTIVYVSTIRVEPTTSMGVAIIIMGLNAIQIADGKQFPYDSTDTDPNNDYWKATLDFNTTSNINNAPAVATLNKITIWNNVKVWDASNPLWSTDDSLTQAGKDAAAAGKDTARFLQGEPQTSQGYDFVKLQFKGFKKSSRPLPPPQCAQLIGIIESYMGTACGDANYNAVADVTKTGNVNFSDLATARYHADAGDAAWCTEMLADSTDPSKRRLDEPTHGNPDANIEIVLFSDFQCPFCAMLDSTMELLMAEHGGEINLVFRNFPLEMHPNAFMAAIAAECAHEQGKFWEYKSLLFQNQANLGIDSLEVMAHAISGINTTSFDSCLYMPKYFYEVKDDDINAGITAGVDAVPTFFVNGKKFLGIMSYEALEEEIFGTGDTNETTPGPDLNVGGSKFEMSFRGGWNLFSLPGEFETMENSCDTRNWVLLEYNRADGSFNYALAPEPGKGYWLHVPQGGDCKVKARLAKTLQMSEIKPLGTGWNFVAISPAMAGMRITELGDCIYQSAYFYDTATKNWENTIGETIGTERIGQTIVVKTGNNCSIFANVPGFPE